MRAALSVAATPWGGSTMTERTSAECANWAYSAGVAHLASPYSLPRTSRLRAVSARLVECDMQPSATAPPAMRAAGWPAGSHTGVMTTRASSDASVGEESVTRPAVTAPATRSVSHAAESVPAAESRRYVESLTMLAVPRCRLGGGLCSRGGLEVRRLLRGSR